MAFITDDFLLHNSFAKELFHQFAKEQPIIDYHNHLSPKEVAENHQFKDITEIWLNYDHYKWRAMRANGVPEALISDTAADPFERFNAWAKTVPYLLRNPLYHWTHLELKNSFGITELLNENSSKRIFDQCNEMLQDKSMSAQGILKQFDVRTICTTDEPLDSLEYHAKHAQNNTDLAMLPTFRADVFVKVDAADFLTQLGTLSTLTHIEVNEYTAYLKAIEHRVDYFVAHGCILSDIGLDTFYAEDYTAQEITNIFDKVFTQKEVSLDEVRKLKSAVLVDLSRIYHKKGWVQQFHFGCVRNPNTKMMNKIGPNTGFDTIGDWNHGLALGRFLDTLDQENSLPKTVLYNLNPNDNNLIATMAASFNTDVQIGKIQFGSGWWFNDQKMGMIDQLNALSNHGLLSRFVGMLTDSRAILSFSRHEYFRRILCNLLGEDMQKNELPQDLELVGKLVSDVSFANCKDYFDLDV